ncbi:vacuole membrane protein 1-like protein [Leptotrombidium deliense]|uniref:Vacuole membrane protein 1-like protein n=1 Tax=Leptotrombidium deliense TaxID=299467 RepID=A0A443SQV0_9ACAR|nr:vacuole membrane protein 1-like protein [Leptotrombidium deliense]
MTRRLSGLNYKPTEVNATRNEAFVERRIGQKNVLALLQSERVSESSCEAYVDRCACIAGKEEVVVVNGKTSSKSGKASTQSKAIGSDARNSRKSPPLQKSDLVLWRRPFLTLNYFTRESLHLLHKCYLWLSSYYKLTGFVILNILFLLAISKLEGPHQKYLLFIEKKLIWCGYWVGLGILSSIGLGTGLHTFLLYLGPHIASVTLAAQECGSLNFPEPPYPDEIVCPSNGNGNSDEISLLSIMSKVRLEAFMWGAGTALGELPPYFVARASRLSGQNGENADDEYDDSSEDGTDSGNGRERKKRTFLSKCRQSIKLLVERVGFFGILACASIPNPLFDLAGITCGHFLIPFWTFFGATLIGKAVIKMHIQKLFVIIAFNEHHVETFVDWIRKIPYIGKYVNEPFREFLFKQKASLHRKAGTPPIKEPSWLAVIFEKVVLLMIAYFIYSIVNSMAQNYLERMQKSHTGTKRKKAVD